MIMSASPIRMRSGLLRILRAAPVVLTLGVVVPASGQTSPTAQPDQTYTLQRIYKQGDIDKYRLTVSTKMSGAQTGGPDFDIHMTMVLKETTVSVASDGLVTITDEYPKADGEFNGTPLDMTQMMPKVTLKRDKKGNVEVTTDGPNEQINTQISGMAKQLMQSSSATLPTKPVKIGDSWTVDSSAVSTAVDAGAKSTTTVKLASIEMVNGTKTLKLDIVTDSEGGKDPNAKMHVEGSVYIDAKSGKPIKMTSKGSGVAAGNKISVDMKMEQGGVEETKAPVKDTGPK